jgi:hypothetical protein
MAGAADDELERRLVGDESGTMNFRNGSAVTVRGTRKLPVMVTRLAVACLPGTAVNDRQVSEVQRTDDSLHDEQQVSTIAVAHPPKLTGCTQSEAVLQPTEQMPVDGRKCPSPAQSLVSTTPAQHPVSCSRP